MHLSVRHPAAKLAPSLQFPLRCEAQSPLPTLPRARGRGKILVRAARADPHRTTVDCLLNLVNLDAAKQAERVIGLFPPFRRATRPDLGGDDHLISPALEDLRQRLLRPAVPGPPAHASGALVPCERLRRSQTERQRFARCPCQWPVPASRCGRAYGVP